MSLFLQYIKCRFSENCIRSHLSVCRLDAVALCITVTVLYIYTKRYIDCMHVTPPLLRDSGSVYYITQTGNDYNNNLQPIYNIMSSSLK